MGEFILHFAQMVYGLSLHTKESMLFLCMIIFGLASQATKLIKTAYGYLLWFLFFTEWLTLSNKVLWAYWTDHLTIYRAPLLLS